MLAALNYETIRRLRCLCSAIMPDHVCLSCGACCAAFRVDFHPLELAGGQFAWAGGVPLAHTVPVTAQLVRMTGTDASPPRCEALSGDIGQRVACSIYDARPSPCRELEAGCDACARARARHGLASLV